MRLLALSGRRTEALARYETFRRVLAEELNVEPTAETLRLYKRIQEGTLGGSARVRLDQGGDDQNRRYRERETEQSIRHSHRVA